MPLAPRQGPRPGRQPIEIRDAQPVRGPGEQPHQVISAGRVGSHRQQRDDVANLGHREQAAQADHLHGKVSSAQSLDHGNELRPPPAQHRRRDPGGPPALGVPLPRDPIREVRGLGGHRRAPGHLHDPGSGTGRGLQAADQDRRRRAQRRSDPVGHREHGLVVAPAHRQMPHLGAVRGGIEQPGEPGQRRGARAAPAVDRLMRIANRDDRDRRAPGRVGEQGPQQHQLGLAGVLELVQQDHPVALPFLPGHLRHVPRQACRQGYLVGEVEAAALPLELGVRRHQRRELPAGGHDLEQLAHLLRQPLGPGRPGRQRVHVRLERRVIVGQLLDGAQVLGQFAGERDDGLGHGRLSVAHPVHRAVVGEHYLVRQLPGRRLGEQPRVRLDPESQAVVGDDTAGVGVVGGYGGRRVPGAGVVIGGRPESGVGQRAQSTGDPRGELTGALAGKGQTEHVRWGQVAVGHQPHHPGRHGLGLARAGAGDDEHAGQRGLDDGPLLRRRRGTPEHFSDLRRVVAHLRSPRRRR